MLGNVLSLGANLLVFYGVWRWDWDAFQLLILYWCDTGIVAFWSLAKLWLLPQHMLGTMTVNGGVVSASNRLLLELFAPALCVFLTVHLAFLWLFFAGGSAAAVQGPVTFVRELVFASAAWLPLLVAFLAGVIDFARTPKRKSWISSVERRLVPDRCLVADGNSGSSVGVGPAIAAPLARIALMQVAVIVGAVLVRKFGTDAPFYVLIGLKALFDFRRPSA